MKKSLIALFFACGTISTEELAMSSSAVVDESTAATSEPAAYAGVAAASVDPCTLVDGRDHQDVTFTTLQIDNSDSRCPVGRYSTQGSSSTGSLPFFGLRCGCCAATLTSTTRPSADGGTEAVCHVTSSCQVCFNGGNTQASCDLWFDERGGFTGTQESASTGQLCPYVKVGLTKSSP